MSSRDLLWKGMIHDFSFEFIQFFMPALYEQIDRSVPSVFLDKELAKYFPKQKGEVRYVDKLVKIELLSGEERYILIHIGVQGYTDKDFAMRKFIYLIQLYDIYRERIVAITILTDNNPDFHPKEFIIVD